MLWSQELISVTQSWSLKHLAPIYVREIKTAQGMPFFKRKDSKDLASEDAAAKTNGNGTVVTSKADYKARLEHKMYLVSTLCQKL